MATLSSSFLDETLTATSTSTRSRQPFVVTSYITNTPTPSYITRYIYSTYPSYYPSYPTYPPSNSASRSSNTGIGLGGVIGLCVVLGIFLIILVASLGWSLSRWTEKRKLAAEAEAGAGAVAAGAIVEADAGAGEAQGEARPQFVWAELFGGYFAPQRMRGEKPPVEPQQPVVETSGGNGTGTVDAPGPIFGDGSAQPISRWA